MRKVTVLAFLFAVTLRAQLVPLSISVADHRYLKLTGGTLTNLLTVNNLTISGTCTGCTSGAVPTTRNINTTAPLGGGGDLSADRTLTCTACATSSNNLSFFSATTSLQLKTLVSDETGSGPLVFGTSPNITTPTGIVKGDVGLGSVDNTSDATKNAAAVTLTNKTFDLGSNTFTATSAQLRTAISDETGSGGPAVFATGPSVTGLNTDTLQTSGNVGLGGAPNATSGRLLDVTKNGNQLTFISAENSDAASTGAASVVRAHADTSVSQLAAYGTGFSATLFGVNIGGWGSLNNGAAGSGLLIGTTNASPVRIGANNTASIILDGTTAGVSMPLTLAVTGHTTFEGVTSTGATGTGKLVYDTSPTFATSAISPLFRSTAAKVLIQGTGTGATQLAATQTTVPTCSTNCGTSPSVAGTDTAGIVTMGATGSPASGWVVTFNGTWAAAPACMVMMAKAGMLVTKEPLTVVTTTTTFTVVTNGVAPANGDVYSYICVGTQ
jgi:hypothetical protein